MNKGYSQEDASALFDVWKFGWGAIIAKALTGLAEPLPESLRPG